MRIALVLACLAAGCNVGDRYLVAPQTLASITALPLEARPRHAAPAVRQKGAYDVAVRTDAFSLGEAVTRPDGQVAIPTRMFSKRIRLGHILVWIGTPISIAGVLMIILGQDAVRWSGIAMAGAAEPVMIAGTVIWVRGSFAHPQEVPRGLPDLTYLPTPGAPPSR